MPVAARVLFLDYIEQDALTQHVVVLPPPVDQALEEWALPSTAPSQELGIGSNKLASLQTKLQAVADSPAVLAGHLQHHSIGAAARWIDKQFATLDAVDEWALSLRALGFQVTLALTAAVFYQGHWGDIQAQALLHHDGKLLRDLFQGQRCATHTPFDTASQADANWCTETLAFEACLLGLYCSPDP